MAQYTCPSCGKRYNGRRCSNCLYENFAEEYSHGSHTHAGEPLVIRDPQRRPIPRKDPFGCEKKTRKFNLRLLVLVIILLGLIGPVAQAVIGFVLEAAEGTPAASASVKADAVLPSRGMTLYDNGNLRVVADWEVTRKYEDGIRIVAENHTQHNLIVTAREILVNNYLMENSHLYIPVESGHTAEGWLYLDSSDLEQAEITDVQWVYATIEAYDSDSYETIMETESMALCSSSVMIQTLADSGEVLFDQDGILIVCKGYVPSSYDPESFSEGEILFYLQNRTDVTVDLYTEDVTVNGQETYLSLWCSLPPNTQAVRRMYLFDLSDGDLNIQSREDLTEMLVSFAIQMDDESGTTRTTDPLSIPFQLDWTK